MASSAVRRSARIQAYDSNGRDYLACQVDWSREKFESWITSPGIQRQLCVWYELCVAGAKRYNDAVGWINNSAYGYYYNPAGLEHDLLELCLAADDNDEDEGNEAQRRPAQQHDHDATLYADMRARPGYWTTQELWARTAWRIVSSNGGLGQVFEQHGATHSAASYEFAIDILCLAFHSIAFRGNASVYARLINGHSEKMDCAMVSPLADEFEDMDIDEEEEEEGLSEVAESVMWSDDEYREESEETMMTSDGESDTLEKGVENNDGNEGRDDDDGNESEVGSVIEVVMRTA